MKKIIYWLTSSVLLIGVLTCCNGNNTNSMETVEDDSVKNDSIVAVEAAAAAAEQTRLDSIRLDSIANAETEEFYNMLPDPKKVTWDGNAGAYLKKLGFEGSTKGDPDDEATGTYTLKLGERECTVKFEVTPNEGITEISIKGDKDALDKYYKRAAKLRSTWEEGGTEVKKKGDTIIIDSYGA